MVKKLSPLFALALFLAASFTCRAFAVEFLDEIPEDPVERWAYIQSVQDTISYPTKAQYSKMKPVIQKVVSESGKNTIYLTALPGYEEYLEHSFFGGFDNVKVARSTAKNGKYEISNGDGYIGGNCGETTIVHDSEVIDGTVYPLDNTKVYYYKVKYTMWAKDGSGAIYETQWSDPVASSIAAPNTPYQLQAGRISNSKVYVTFPAQDGLTRALYVRKKGTTKWYNVKTASYVKSVKAKSDGFVLEMNAKQDYEFSGRFTKTINGKKYTSDYSKPSSGYYNPTDKVKEISFLRYSPDHVALGWSDLNQSIAYEPSDGYQIKYRKAGSSDSWQILSEYDTLRYTRFTAPAEIGYEYKIRKFNYVGTQKVYGSYSKVYKCTEKSAAFVNKLGAADYTGDYNYIWEETDEQTMARPTYDHSLTIKKNYNQIASFVMDQYSYVLNEHGMGGDHDQALWNPQTARVDLSRENEGKVGIHVFGGFSFQTGPMTMELMSFFAEDRAVGCALFHWVEAIHNYGSANSDQFGFHDVIETKNGFIIEMNGVQIEFENTDNGTIYWFSK